MYQRAFTPNLEKNQTTQKSLKCLFIEYNVLQGAVCGGPPRVSSERGDQLVSFKGCLRVAGAVGGWVGSAYRMKMRPGRDFALKSFFLYSCFYSPFLSPSFVLSLSLSPFLYCVLYCPYNVLQPYHQSPEKRKKNMGFLVVDE